MLDTTSIRADFPILDRQVGKYPLVYLDSANTGQKPASVIAAVDDFYRRHNANVSRAVHALGSELVALRISGHADKARQRLDELHTLRDELIRCLHALSAVMVQQQA